MDVIIIGGGASGMMAAISAKINNNCNVTILEKQPRVGKKLLATGNGRCNLSNKDLSIAHYHGQNPEFAIYALDNFNFNDTINFFKKLGLLTICDANGKIYPLSEQSTSVLDVLRLAIEHTDTSIITNTEVSSVNKKGNKFLLHTSNGDFTADKIIVSSGGLAGTNASLKNSGYNILKSLGHTCTKLYASLVQIRTDSTYTKSLKGIRADAKIGIYKNGSKIAENCGEIQFTEYGISGPAVFEISRFINGKDNLVLHIDLLKDLSLNDVIRMIKDKCNRFPDSTSENLLVGSVHNKLGRVLLKYAGFGLNMRVCDLSLNDIKCISKALKEMKIRIIGNMPLCNAQVTMGGVKTSQFNNRTLESLKQKGLYVCGEVLDIDGDCGGYNLQWAWSSGFLAGKLL